MPARKILDVAIQLAQGLARAHAAGIVHRDLKPENAVVTDDGIVKILDFGLAKLIRSPLEAGASSDGATATMGTEPGLLLGTYGYMSPEQASGKPLDFRSDQFSFGSILYEMATGRRAFQKSEAVDTLSAILHAEPEPIAKLNAAVPTPLRWIVERCLAKDPRDRYASTEDLARDLTSLREHLSEASQAGAVFALPAQRRLPLWALLGAAGVVVLALGIFAGRRLVKAPLHPRFQQLTFRRGGIWSARFAPDGQTIVYGASWEGRPLELFTTRVGSAEYRPAGSRPHGRPFDLIERRDGRAGRTELRSPAPPAPRRQRRSGIARLLYGTVARVPLAGGTPRELVENALWADWSPDGERLAVVHEVGGLHRIEYPVGTVIYENAPWVNRPRISRDGRLVAFQDNKEIKVIEPPGKARDLGKKGDEIAWSSSGSEIWYSQFDGVGTAIRAVTPSGDRDREVVSLPGDFVLYDIAADGRVLMARASETSQVYMLRAGESRPRDLSWFDRPEVRGLSADGKTVLFDEMGPSGGTYLRGTDGSPAKRVGDSGSEDLSPDGKWVLSSTDVPTCCGFRMIPTGPGSTRALPRPLEDEWVGRFLGDGRRLFSIGSERGRPGQRGWIRDLESGKARPVTPENTYRIVPSPDGKFLSGLATDGHYYYYGVETGEAAAIAGLMPGEEPIQWSVDGRTLFVRGADENLAEGAPTGRVFRLDPRTGRRELFREIPSLDPSAGGGVGRIIVSADEKTIVYTHYRFPSDLFLVEGLR